MYIFNIQSYTILWNIFIDMWRVVYHDKIYYAIASIIARDCIPTEKYYIL